VVLKRVSALLEAGRDLPREFTDELAKALGI